MRFVRRAVPIALAVVAVALTVSAADLTSSGLSSTDLALQKSPNTGVPPAPDPNVILQGGDTCGQATVIPSLPYSDTGTTVGLTDDLQPATCSSAGGAPDAVYVYTPSVDQLITVSLCTATAYDSTVYVLAGACPGPEIACNDDDCGLQSRIATVPVTAGTPYYIIIDGFSSSSGTYSLDVTEVQPPPPPAECDGPDLLYYQTVMGPDDAWNAFTSAQTSQFDYEVADNFTSDLYSITDFHWWGLSLLYNAGWFACDPTGLTFDLTFYADAGGQPGTAVCSFTGLTPTATVGASYGGYTLYYWDVTGLSPACQPTGATWVAVKSYANAADCAFLWMSGTGGDGAAMQWNAGVWGACGG